MDVHGDIEDFILNLIFLLVSKQINLFENVDVLKSKLECVST